MIVEWNFLRFILARNIATKIVPLFLIFDDIFSYFWGAP